MVFLFKNHANILLR